MIVRIGLIITERSAPLAAVSKASRWAALGAKRAFTMVGGHFDENAIVFAVRTEPIVRAAGTAARVAWHLQNTRASQVTADTAEPTVSAPLRADTDNHTSGAPEFAELRAHLAVLSERLGRLGSGEGI